MGYLAPLKPLGERSASVPGGYRAIASQRAFEGVGQLPGVARGNQKVLFEMGENLSHPADIGSDNRGAGR
jgi:hypothetical protein